MHPELVVRPPPIVPKLLKADLRGKNGVLFEANSIPCSLFDPSRKGTLVLIQSQHFTGMTRVWTRLVGAPNYTYFADIHPNRTYENGVIFHGCATNTWLVSREVLVDALTRDLKRPGHSVWHYWAIDYLNGIK